MGTLLSCLRPGDPEDSEQPELSLCRCRTCFSCFVQPLWRGCNTLFRRRQVHHVPLPAERTINSAFTTRNADCSVIDTFHPPPRPLAYDDPRFSLQHGDVPLSGLDRSSSHSLEETESLRSCHKTCSETGTKDNSDGSKDGVKLHCSYLPLKNSSAETISRPAYYFPPSEDEDVCPTCLEEYTPENPKIILQCYHDYHLSCIYEWMERSEACPVCGKVMMFEET
ncbi:hypothetical protein J5N97_024728 [Dioscorea zingiberensis]|uniref:RING-type E3 ubiquitin transferase n=1 Tax=Dioscorea zingiberensis TaxID=325984 RepID=A0A9D5C709_9LILI|nr:hypothetical protein J5N97_024728 [Dioscorea zingiberensis]